MNHVYKCKISAFYSSSYARVKKQAKNFFNSKTAHSRRSAYVRAPAWKKQKVFLGVFWSHLFDKKPAERMVRLRLLPCALEVLENSTYPFVTKTEPGNPNIFLHRLYGQTPAGQVFALQVKEYSNKQKLYFVSCFPWENKKPRRRS